MQADYGARETARIVDKIVGSCNLFLVGIAPGHELNEADHIRELAQQLADHITARDERLGIQRWRDG